MTWEERMAARAAERTEPMGEPPDPHAGHHVHSRGNASVCSCGAFLGIFSIALSDGPAPRYGTCEECGLPNVLVP